MSTSTKRIFLHAEELACESGIDLLPFHILSSIIELNPQLQLFINEKGGNVQDTIRIIHDEFTVWSDFDPYIDCRKPYSSKQFRDIESRTNIIDICILVARRNLRREIIDTDLIEALFEHHNNIYPLSENTDWREKRLRLPYHTLMHIVGTYAPELNYSFSEIMRFLKIDQSIKSPIEIAPPSIRLPMLKLLQDFPNYELNCFIIMSFASTKIHNVIYSSIKDELGKYNINALRADEHNYGEELLSNISAYIYGCSFAIAVFDRIESEVINPNVSFEVGYMYGLGKQVCLLKEKTIRHLQTDIIGKLYMPFDIQDINGTLPIQINKWLIEIKRI